MRLLALIILLVLSFTFPVLADDSNLSKDDVDPIQENFGARISPYPGFLVLPIPEVPSGFKEQKHHYTKREYTIDFTKTLNGKQIDLNIVEGDFVKFFHDGEELLQEFSYQGKTGQVFQYKNKKTGDISLNLVWLNAPKQRIAIYLTQTPDNEYSAADVINILRSMKPASSS